MRKIIVCLVFFAYGGLAVAASSSDKPMQGIRLDLTDKKALQRGAKLFMDRCFSCHSLSYTRYNDVARYVGLSKKLAMQYLVPEGAKFIDPVISAMQYDNLGKELFGTDIPDLTLVARSRGEKWVFNYLRDFYADPKRPWGVNNHRIANVAMPHVLWDLQGIKDKNGRMIAHGKLTEAEYDRALLDLVGFLSYVSEPVKLDRRRIGIKVLLFLLVLSVLAYALKSNYWKDVKKGSS